MATHIRLYTFFACLLSGLLTAQVFAEHSVAEHAVAEQAVAEQAVVEQTHTERAKTTAIFATGCFWCTESDFEAVKGVISVESGYIRGHVEHPRYEDVVTGRTGHTEAVRILFDPEQVSYEDLLSVFWYSSDPFVKDQQFCDHGNQYRSGIYYLDPAQKQAALDSQRQLVKRHAIDQTIYTEILPATQFWIAEDYHQDYYRKNGLRYRFYRYGCGRDQHLETLWQDRANWKPS